MIPFMDSVFDDYLDINRFIAALEEYEALQDDLESDDLCAD